MNLVHIFRTFAVGALALSASACVGLTSTRPMFAPADHADPAPLVAGTWVMVGDDCSRADLTKQPLPEECETFQLRAAPDGAWIASGFHTKDNAPTEMRVVIATATENVPANTFAPLYVVQYQDNSDPASWSYMAVAPVGTLPASEFFVVALISCEDALRDGPIHGVTSKTGSDGKYTECVASTPAAVREAARRAMIQALPHMDETRLVRLDH